MLGQDVRQQSCQFVSVCRLTEFEDVKLVAVDLLKLVVRFRCQTQVLLDDHLRQCNAKLGKDLLRSFLLRVVEQAVVLEAESLLLGELVVPELHAQLLAHLSWLDYVTCVPPTI